MNRWVAGARPRTLPAAVVPVLVGSGLAAGDDRFVGWRAACALAVALALQVGVNYANDYSDGVRGTDENRRGPVRLVAGGLASPAAVRNASAIAFAVAAIVGGVLSLVVNNLRDIPTDAAAGKRTLAVRLGDDATRALYVALAVGAFAIGAFATAVPASLFTLLVLPFAVPPSRRVLQGAKGPALIGVLQATARLQLLFGVVLAGALWAS